MSECIQPLNYRSVRFLTSAATLKQCPPDSGAEVAFAGRSNAGKSSAINALTGNHKLARTSKTPGRTQLINLFAASEQQRLVDLPGYGFARVPLRVKEEWQRHLSDYLHHRHSLRGLILLMDIRHPLQEFDTMLLDWAIARATPVHLLLTKADKLKRGPAKAVLLSVEKQLQERGAGQLVSAQLFSSTKNIGVGDLARKLDQWLLLE